MPEAKNVIPVRPARVISRPALPIPQTGEIRREDRYSELRAIGAAPERSKVEMNYIGG